VHSPKEIAEIKLEISERCSNITDEDLMNELMQNREKLINLESQMLQLTEQFNELIASNKTEL
jgi:hypothetical protein